MLNPSNTEKITDTYPPDVRSRVMKSIKSRGNRSTEIFFVKLLKAYDIPGWRRHYQVKGKPDFAFLKFRIAIFIDGCFWHGHNCRNTKPKQNAEYWKKKIERNIRRDQKITKMFQLRGWTVYRIWECELGSPDNIEFIKELKKKVSPSHKV